MQTQNNTVYTVNEIRTMLSPVFQNYNVKRAVLFGSYSKGLATPKSDIDLLVDSGLKVCWADRRYPVFSTGKRC